MDVDAPGALAGTGRTKGAGSIDREGALGDDDVAAAECASHLQVQGTIADLGQLEDAILARVGQPGRGDVDGAGAAEGDAAIAVSPATVSADSTYDASSDE